MKFMYTSFRELAKDKNIRLDGAKTLVILDTSFSLGIPKSFFDSYSPNYEVRVMKEVVNETADLAKSKTQITSLLARNRIVDTIPVIDYTPEWRDLALIKLVANERYRPSDDGRQYEKKRKERNPSRTDLSQVALAFSRAREGENTVILSNDGDILNTIQGLKQNELTRRSIRGKMRVIGQNSFKSAA